MVKVKDKKLNVVLERFQKNEITAWKVARLMKISLTEFLDVLKEKNIEFHYDGKELMDEFKDF